MGGWGEVGGGAEGGAEEGTGAACARGGSELTGGKRGGETHGE